MLSEFSRDLSDPDKPVKEAAAKRPGKPIKLRIQPMILNTVDGKGGQYKSWKQVSWTLECDTPAEAFAVRDAMAVFFEVMGKRGPKAVTAALKAAAKESAA